MRKPVWEKYLCRTAGALGAVCMIFALAYPVPAKAEEYYGYEESGLPQTESALSEEYPAETPESVAEGAEDADTQETAAALTGTWTVESGWSVDSAASTQEQTVYKQDACIGAEATSTITCSYLDTNYSVYEYEQLRDMLTNNLLYSNVDAQISTSAVYTDAKDYLYIVLVDDTAQDFRCIYHYVVGDYRCFCVAVKEYRSEAEQLAAQELSTPREVGQAAAEKFMWN